MARTTDEKQSKQRKIMPSPAHLAPGSPEYDRVFKGVQPPVLDDGSPKNKKILEEWRAYVLHHYFKHREAEETMRIKSQANASGLADILPMQHGILTVLLGQEAAHARSPAEVQGTSVIQVAPEALPSTTTATSKELVMEHPVQATGRNCSLLASDENPIWTKESKRISRTMGSNRLTHIPCKVRRKHVSVLDHLGTTGRGWETQNM
ncbi:hypothetical protein EYR40_008333 [Pleurotus pulmonarius]|nr:hypothetical protein EYR40_008333 [Pleurotus pulmonarius]